MTPVDVTETVTTLIPRVPAARSRRVRRYALPRLTSRIRPYLVGLPSRGSPDGDQGPAPTTTSDPAHFSNPHAPR